MDARRDDLSAGQRRLVTAGMVLVHLGALWGLLQVGEVRETVIEAAPVFARLIAPPAPPAPPALPKVQPPLPRPAPVLPQAPQPLPVLAAAPSPVPAAFNVRVAPADPAPAAVAPVTAPPLPPSPAPPAPAVAAAPKVIPASAVQFSEPPAVEYPRLSKRNGETGRVIVRAYVEGAGGAPSSVQVNQSSGHPRLDEAALSAVRKARFKPYTENGQPVAGWALIPIDFELEK